MKEAYYFKHDSNAQNDPKMMALIDETGPEGIGIYWMLVEVLRDQPSHVLEFANIKHLARRWNTTKEKVENVVRGFNLFDFDEFKFYSPSLNRRIKESDDIRAKFQRSGKKGADAKWSEQLENQEEKADIYGTHAPAPDAKKNYGMKGKEMKVNEIKEKEKERKGKNTRERATPSPDNFKISNLIEESKTAICQSFQINPLTFDDFASEWIKRKELTGDYKRFRKEQLISFFITDLTQHAKNKQLNYIQ